MKKRFMGTVKKAMATALTVAMLTTGFAGNIPSVQAAEMDDTAIEASIVDEEAELLVASDETVEPVETPASEATTEATETAPVAEAETEVETETEAEAELSIEDILADVDNTADVAAEEATVEVKFDIPSSCTLAKDGNVMATVSEEALLTTGEYVVSQPTKDENKTRLESEVKLDVDADTDNILVSWEGNLVSGTREDAIGNTVKWDGSTLTITNADALEDVVAEEEEEQPDDPGETPKENSYFVNYYVDEVTPENFLGGSTISDVMVGDIIDWNTIDKNAYKPVDTDTLVYADGVIEESSATVVVEDDTDVVNVIYTSEEEVVVTDTVVTVKYYKDNLTSDNFLGSYQNPAVAGDDISYDNIDYNMYQPSGYGDGVIQTEVSDTIVAADGSSTVWVLYAGSEVITVTETVTETEYVEVPVVETVTETEYVEVPGETVYVEVPSEPEVITETETVTEYRDRLVYLPGGIIRDTETEYVQVPGPERIVYVEVPSDDDEDDDIPNPEDTPDETDSDDPDCPESTPVQTGDATPIAAVALVMIISMLGLVILSRKKVTIENGEDEE